MTESTNIINKLTVVVGAGEDYRCDLSNNTHHYLLIDAREEAAEALQNAYKNEEQVSVKLALIADKAEPVNFYCYSLPEFSSTLKLNELNTVLPGLTLQSNESVMGTPLTEAIEQAPKAKTVELVLNVPGQELALLKSLAAFNQLFELDALTVTASQNMLYKQGNTTTELVSWLEEQGFELTQENNQQFSLVIQSWSIDKKSLRISQLERERGVINEETQKYIDWANNLKSQLEAQIKEKDELVQTLKKKTEEYEKLQKLKAESDNDYKKELSNLKRALDGKSEVLQQKEQELENYKRMEANYNREFYRAESQLELLKELISNGKS